MPRIDQVVDVVAGNRILCFFDAYKGCHQTPIVVEVMEKTAL